MLHGSHIIAQSRISQKVKLSGRLEERETMEKCKKLDFEERIKKASKLIANNEWVPTELCLPQSRTGSPIVGGIKYLVTVQEINDSAMQFVGLVYYHPAGSKRMDYDDLRYDADTWEFCSSGFLMCNSMYVVIAWKPAPKPFRPLN